MSKENEFDNEHGINMGGESSAHNDINKIVLKKKTLDSGEVEETNDVTQDNSFYGDTTNNNVNNTNLNNNTNPINNINNNNNNNNNNNTYNNGFNNTEVKPANQNIQGNQTNNNQNNQINYSIHKKEIKKTSPSILIIFIIILVVFSWDIVSDLINKKSEPEEPKVIETNDNQTQNNDDDIIDNVDDTTEPSDDDNNFTNDSNDIEDLSN